ncbi:YidC/Oxa1 family membrane protein insertase [Paratractidigestivibacter sp.]|uniref:YidC/Oxa1 family membrane protein insertase n=1 Tax=Paratractidigestivibacter sp. TaxID=2847316 RepID=UPI002ABE3228|nr:YidC/Oxa1 family membrane protein insertase [Paratractidigestivibacter sp.]
MWDWFINFLYAALQGIQGFVGDWGLSVICLTIVVRLILMPLQTKSVKSTAGMQVMQPRIQEIQEKYADDPQRLQEETMKIYSEMNVNPLMGCLPMLLQMPIFFALFTVIKMVPEGSCFFSILPSISDSVSGVLAASGFVPALPYIIMDVLFGVLTFVPMMMNSQTMDPSQRQQQMIMGAVMSIMMLWFGWTCPAAVLLYYVTSSLWQVVQQQLVTKKVIAKAKADAEERAKNAPLEVNVTRREKKPRQHKKS